MPTAVVKRRVFVDLAGGRPEGSGRYPAADSVSARSTRSTSRANSVELVLGRVAGRQSDADLTTKSLGMAVEDVVTARLVVERARAAGLGQTFELAKGLVSVAAGRCRGDHDGVARFTNPIGTPERWQPAPAASAAIEQAFRAAYSLDHDDALAHARRAVALGPNESQSHRTLAAILWLHILFRRGAVSIDYYMGSLARQCASSPKADPALVAEFQAVLARAIELAEARLKQNPAICSAVRSRLQWCCRRPASPRSKGA